MLGQITALLGAATALVLIHRQVPAGGWTACGVQLEQLCDLTPATVEPVRRSADRTCHVVWLVGPTHLAYASSRGRLRVDGRSSSVLQLATARRLLTGPGHLTPQAARLATVLRLPAAVKLPVALARLQSAPWTARLRDFALDLALGVLEVEVEV